MKSSTFQRGTLFIVTIFAVWLSYYLMQPPEPKPKSSAETEFSADRAFEHIKTLAQTPRPIGTAANDSARNYIINELRELGLQPKVQAGIGIGSSFDRGLVGNAKNIMASMEGSNPQRTILLMAHYDSKPNTYGAGDDASGVAAILESIRALKSQNRPLQNNVLILFTDAEERGLLGAELFAEKFEKLDKIDLVLNFESRGSSGPSLMFETSENNGHLIPHFAQATPYPVANSLMYTVYKLLPNDTDMSVTKRVGLNGLNFAFTKDYLHYHTMLDTPENLSRASVQHHGSNLLGNLRHFGNINFDLQSDTEFVYFNNVTGGLLYYPSGWSFPLALVSGLLFVALLIYLFRTKQITVGRYLGSLLLFALTISLGAFITYFGWQGLKALHPQYQWIIQGEVYNHAWYFWGFTLLNTGLFVGIYGWIQSKLSLQLLISGPFTIWIILSLVTAWYLPTAAYIFTWPALMGLAGWITLGEQLDSNIYSWKAIAVLAIAFFWGLFIISPYIKLVQIMLTTEMLAVSMVVLLLLTGLSWPLIWFVIKNNQYKWSGGILSLSLICLLAASFYSDFNQNRKKQNSINFVQNIDTNTAYWVSRDPKVDEWTRQFLSQDYKSGTPTDSDWPFRGEVLYEKATPIDIPKPTFEVMRDSSFGSERHLTLKMNAGKGIAMKMNWSPSSIITKVGIEDKSIFDDQDMGRYLYYFNNFSKAVKINLSYQNSERAPSLDFTFIDPGLPTKLVKNFQPRPDYIIPAPYSVLSSDAIIWETKVEIEDLLSKR